MKSVFPDVTVIATCTCLFQLFHIVSCQCSGTALLLYANETFQSFSSDSYPSNYPNNLQCEWQIEATNSSHIIRLEITDSVIEYHTDCVYDTGEVFDGSNSSASSLGKFCGTDTPTYISTGYQLSVTFRSDYSLAFKGFLARYKSGVTETLDEEEEDIPTSGIDVVTVIAAGIGGVALVVVILVVIFVYIQSKKAKRNRERLLARRGLVANTSSGSRVYPYDNENRRNLIGPPPPPAYGDIYNIPMSPPPAYSETDPNPQNGALPGTPDIPMPDSTRSTNGAVNASAVTQAPDFNSNTHFSMIGLPGRRGQNANANATPRQNSNSSQSQINTSVRRSLSNPGAMAVMRTLNPTAYATNNSLNSPRTLSDVNGTRTATNLGVNPASLPTNTAVTTPRDIDTDVAQTRVNAGNTRQRIQQSVVEVEVHRNRSEVSSLGSNASDLSEMTLPSALSRPSSEGNR